MKPDEPTTPPHASETSFSIVYDELKRVARRQLRGQDANATLCTTELVHEAYMKLGSADGDWDSRAHFFGSASRAMRQVLVDFARRRRADRRGGSWRRVSLSDVGAALQIELDEILALDDALEHLDAVDPRLREVVELRFFGGLSNEDVGRILGVSPRTVERDWLKARLLLLHELQLAPGSDPG
ncbi:MAG TPA: ECF-type sigma factor [Gemmatimonadota bacterium]|nr:ECF-type sigma factor [Gemmatimonadota bacterium]